MKYIDPTGHEPETPDEPDTTDEDVDYNMKDIHVAGDSSGSDKGTQNPDQGAKGGSEVFTVYDDQLARDNQVGLMENAEKTLAGNAAFDIEQDPGFGAYSDTAFLDMASRAGVDLNTNRTKAAAAGGRLDIAGFVTKVKSGGDWDYKNNSVGQTIDKIYGRGTRQAFGNWHFGIVASEFGFSAAQSLAGAGAYQAFFQGGGAKIGSSFALVGALVWRDADVRLLVNAGYQFGDNLGDAGLIYQGYRYAND